MLVVISDLHLTDGSATSTLHPGAMHLFIQQMRDLAERAGWRTNGRYQPIDPGTPLKGPTTREVIQPP